MHQQRIVGMKTQLDGTKAGFEGDLKVLADRAACLRGKSETLAEIRKRAEDIKREVDLTLRQSIGSIEGRTAGAVGGVTDRAAAAGPMGSMSAAAAAAAAAAASSSLPRPIVYITLFFCLALTAYVGLIAIAKVQSINYAGLSEGVAWAAFAAGAAMTLLLGALAFVRGRK